MEPLINNENQSTCNSNNTYSKEEIKSLFLKSKELSKFNFNNYKSSLLKNLKEKNKNVNQCFEEIISNYQQLIKKNKSLEDKIALIDREQPNNLRKSSEALKHSMIGIGGVNNKETEYLQLRISELEKELLETNKENKNSHAKLFEIVSENMKLKDQLSQLLKQKDEKQTKINELEEVISKLEKESAALKDDNSKLKLENNKLDQQNLNLNNENRKKNKENNDLIDQILTIKNDYGNKMNELMEMIDDAKQKKDAADLYFKDKKDTYLKNSSLGIDSSKLDEFKIIVEEVKIPNKMKAKISAHNKNITGMKFSNFGSNLITCGVDSFIKNWDCSKSNK